MQYTNCDDPRERAARIERVLVGEEQGLMAETAANIIAAATSNLIAHANMENPDNSNIQTTPNATNLPLPSPTQGNAARSKRNSTKTRSFMGANSKKRVFSQITASPSKHGYPHTAPIHQQSATRSHTQARATRPPRPMGSTSQGTSQDFPVDPAALP